MLIARCLEILGRAHYAIGASLEKAVTNLNQATEAFMPILGPSHWVIKNIRILTAMATGLQTGNVKYSDDIGSILKRFSSDD